MKKFYFWMLAAATLLSSGLALTSCDDGPENPPIPPETVPTVTLSAGEATEASITFTVASKDADKCAYRVLPTADDAPDAAAVLTSGTAVPANESKRVEVAGLSENTSYTVYAAASVGERVGELKTVTMTTKKGQAPEEVTIIELERAQDAFYYTDDEEGTVGNFYFSLARGEMDDHYGFPAPGEDNFLLCLDLYTDIPADLEHPVLSQGTYTMANESGVVNTFFVAANDLSGPSVCFTENFGAIEFKDGTFAITYADGQYTLSGDVVSKEDDRKYRFLYTGEIPFVNKDLPPETSVTCTEADAVWYGDLYGMNTCVWELQMRDVSLAQDKTPTAAGTLINLTLFGEPCQFADASLTEGEYTFSNTFGVRTMMMGGQDGNGGYLGSIVRKWDGRSYAETLCMNSGTLTLTRSGDNYTAVLDAVTDRGVVVKASYTGQIAITGDDSGDPDDPGFSTIKGDVVLNQEDVLYATLYDFGEIIDGVNTMEFDLENDDVMFCISLNVALDVTGYVPSGTYTVAPDLEPESYVPFSVEPAYQYNGNANGTRYDSFTDGIGYVKSGTVEIERIGETDEYKLTWNFVDDSPQKHKITGSYQGVFEVL